MFTAIPSQSYPADLAPVILFVYNRPEHTEKMLNSLVNNHLADRSVLYIFADGIRENATETEKNAVLLTRQIISQKNWCKTVHIIEADRNLGLAQAIVNGVTQTLQKHGKVIVLEDDLLLAPGFLSYMNQSLDLYANSPQVMHISGYIFPIDTHNFKENTFFYNQASSWGWATWQRAWNFFENDASKLIDGISQIPNGKSYFNIDDGFDFFGLLEENAAGTKKTWAVKWQASILLKNGLCLHPKKTLLNNIGNDGSGVHKGFTNKYLNPAIADFLEVKPIPLQESLEARALMKQFYLSNLPKKSLIPLWFKQSIANALPNKLKSRLFQWLMRKKVR
ncbi:MAG: glycosyltransferase [Verrucomicrobia bacterium]|nr:glycosyltransferase [Cytophagales bacterium]